MTLFEFVFDIVVRYRFFFVRTRFRGRFQRGARCSFCYCIRLHVQFRLSLSISISFPLVCGWSLCLLRQNDKRHGRGRYGDTGGDVYEGQWVNDSAEGEGKYVDKE